MAQQDRSPDQETSTGSGQEKVVRLPVPDELADQLAAIPAAERRLWTKPNPEVDLMEEEVEDPIELPPAALGVGWEDEEAERGQTPVGWLVMIGAILLALGGWALGKLVKGEEHLNQQAERVEAGWQKEEREYQEALALLTRVERTAEAYLEADSVTAKAEYVRHAERVKPLMEKYYERNPLKPAEFESIEKIRPGGIDHRPFNFITVNLEGGGTTVLFMEETANGELKFDWEGEVAYQPMELEEYIAKKPTEPMVFRLYARRDSFYAYEFSNRDRAGNLLVDEFDRVVVDEFGNAPLDENGDPLPIWRVYMLTARDTDAFLFGYIERGTEDDLRLKEYLDPDIKRRKPVMLRLRFLPGTKSRRSVVIDEVVALRWLHLELPEPED